jgi:hypothetical protein
LSNHPNNVTAQVVRNDEFAIEVTQEAHVSDTACLGGRDLLGPSDAGNFGSRNVSVNTTGAAIGTNAVRHVNASGHPGGDSPSRSEIDIIGMGGNYQGSGDISDHKGPISAGHACRDTAKWLNIGLS